MLRLGFFSAKLGEADRVRIQTLLDAAYPRLAELKMDLAEIRAQIDGINDIESLLMPPAPPGPPGAASCRAAGHAHKVHLRYR